MRLPLAVVVPWTKCSAFLLSLLLTAVASLSAQPHDQQRRIPPTTAAFPRIRMMTSSSSSSNNNYRQRRRRAPLVDSDLLRFLSQQQRANPLVQPVQKRRIPDKDDGTNERQASQQSAGGKSTVSETAAATVTTTASPTTTSAFASQDADTDCNTWLRQYERHAVAQRLQRDDNIGENMALAAGIAVEQTAVARAARRRVRTFLRHRDAVWASTASSSESAVDATIQTEQTKRQTATASAAAAVQDDDDDTIVRNSNNNNLEQVLDLMLEYGLSIKDCAEILIHTPGIAFMRPRPLVNDEHTEEDDEKTNNDSSSNGETLQQTLDRVFTGLLMGRGRHGNGADADACGTWQLQLRKYDARKILRHTPGLLTVRGSRSAEQVVRLLCRLGVSSASLSRVAVHCPHALTVLLSRPPAAVFRLVAFLSSDDVRMPLDQIGPLLRRAECQDLLDAVAPPVSRLPVSASSSSSGYDAIVAAQIRREVVNNHFRNMSRTAWILRHEIGTEDLSKVIAAYPSVLLLDAAKQILPTAHYLMEELGICSGDLPRVLQLYPILLRTDVEQMRQIAAYLTSLEVDPENFGSIFRSFPNLLTLDVEHDMEPVVDFLRDEVGIANVGRFLTRLPPVLGYSVERELRPKYEFLAAIVRADPRFEVSKFPAFFSYPLERGKTRFAYLRDVKGVPTALVSLDKVLSCGDRDFATRVAGDRDHGAAYQEFVKARQRRQQASLAPAARRRRRKAPSSPSQQQPQQPRAASSSSSGQTGSSNRRREPPSPPSVAAVPS